MNISCSNQDPCPVILDSKCVIYEGENLLYIGVNTNDNYRTALENVNTAIGNLVLGGGITELIGDVVAYGPGVASATLATVNSTPGQYGSSTAIPKVTVDGKGRVTAITTEAVLIPSGSLNFIGEVTGSGTTGTDTTLTMVNASVIAKVLSGLNVTGGSISSADTIIKAFGKLQNQINGLIGGSIYQGTWNAATNTPTLTSGVGTKGWYYIVNTPGTTNLDGYDDWGLGDWAIFDGTAWQQVDNTDAVVSVNGEVGAVSLTTDNIPEGTFEYFTQSRARLALSGGTGISYDNITGVITNTITQYTDALARQAISLTTTGSSGAATYSSITGVLNIPNYTSALTGYVPYTGATANVDLGTYGLLADYLQLNVLPTAVPTTVSTMSWNDNYGTMDIRLKRGNVSLQVGQENVVPVINKTGTNLLESNYQVVRVRSAAEGGAQGQRLAVKLALADSDTDSATTLGIVTENINDNQEGFITVFGNVSEINTTGSLQGETWVDGDILYLSPTVPGALTKIKPVAPQHMVTVGYVVYAHSQHGIIFTKIDNGYELEELHNVYAPDASKVNNDVLTWNAATSLWVNRSIVDNLGYTPVPTTRTLTINGVSYDLSADRSWTIPAGVTSFNTRTGAITLVSTDVTSALGFSPANGANYLALTGGTLTGTLNGTSAAFTSYVTANGYYVPNTAEQGFATLNGSNGMLVNGTSGYVVLMSGGNETLFLSNTGRVGIGTNGPGAPLGFADVTGLKIQFNANAVNYYGIEKQAAIAGGDGLFKFESGKTSAGEFAFSSGGTNRMVITSVGTVQPGANGTQDLGSTSLRWATVYTSDLDMSNGIGDYTIVEGKEDLFLYNNLTNKVFKFALIEVDPSQATPKLKK